MERINCNIIKDILPLYVDNVVSDETKKLIEEHLEHCEECKKEISILNNGIVLQKKQNAWLQEAEPLKIFKKQWRNKKIIISITSVIITIAIIFSLFFYMTSQYTVIPYDSSLITVEEIDGQVYAHYHGNTYGFVESNHPDPVQIDGELKQIVIFSYSESFWSKYIEPLYQGKDERDEKDYIFPLGDMYEIDMVFYGKYSIRNNLPKLPVALENMPMIWGE